MSLSIWLLIALVLLPFYVHVNKQHLQVEQELVALNLLYESLNGYLVEGIKENRDRVERSGGPYEITWSDEDESPPKVCVLYENPFGKEVSACKSIE